MDGSAHYDDDDDGISDENFDEDEEGDDFEDDDEAFEDDVNYYYDGEIFCCGSLHTLFMRFKKIIFFHQSS